ncbi:MAG TPA: aromatic ring-hydroxylating dioxygenase subunit alpha [Xanthobacteraceae bacterium]|jgi:phenylpropionate dioxygenase-like ring-hydroxylating dioxygenase large terminal subunit
MSMISQRASNMNEANVQSEPAPSGRRVGALALGLPRHWYPILQSSDVASRPVRIKRFGEWLAVWRGEDGQPNVVQDRCPHRGASLSQGTIRGSTLSCAYHGWTFDRSGSCVEIPFADGQDDKRAATMRRAALKSFPAKDRAGYIWAFYGAAADVTPLSIAPYELEDPRWSLFQQQYVWNTSWLNILDNILDPVHALFVHFGVATQLRRAQLSQLKIEDFDGGFRLSKGGMLEGKMTEETPAELRLPSVFRLDLADGSPRGLMRVLMIPTPIDESSTYLVYIQGRRVTGLARLRWRVQWWTKYRAAQNTIKAQDLAILEGLGPIETARAQENLTHSDAGVVHLRRRLNQAFAEAQNPSKDAPPGSRLKPAPRLYASWENDPE